MMAISLPHLTPVCALAETLMETVQQERKDDEDDDNDHDSLVADQQSKKNTRKAKGSNKRKGKATANPISNGDQEQSVPPQKPATAAGPAPATGVTRPRRKKTKAPKSNAVINSDDDNVAPVSAPAEGVILPAALEVAIPPTAEVSLPPPTSPVYAAGPHIAPIPAVIPSAPPISLFNLPAASLSHPPPTPVPDLFLQSSVDSLSESPPSRLTTTAASLPDDDMDVDHSPSNNQSSHEANALFPTVGPIADMHVNPVTSTCIVFTFTAHH